MLRAIYPLLVSEKYIIFVLKLLDVYSRSEFRGGKELLSKSYHVAF